MKKSKILMLIGLSLIFVITCSATVMEAVDLYHIKQSKSWLTVTGTVIEASVGVYSQEAGNSYYPLISYQYTVNNKLFTSDHFLVGGAYYLSSNQDAQKYVSEHAVGSTIKVYFNPNNHEESALMPGLHWIQLKPWTTLVVFDLVLLAYMVLTIIESREKKEISTQVKSEFRFTYEEERDFADSYPLIPN